jgi:hypothetical protein
LRAAVENLDDVYPGRNAFDCFLPQMAAGAVVRMFEINESSLLLDGGDCFLGRQSIGDGRLQEQADQLTLRGQDLLADDHGLTGVEERSRSVDTIMIGQDNGREADLPAATSNLKGRDPAIKRGRTVQVEIKPDPGNFPSGDGRVGAAPCASSHVRYYRPEEGSGKGSRKVRAVRGGSWLVKNA